MANGLLAPMVIDPNAAPPSQASKTGPAAIIVTSGAGTGRSTVSNLTRR